MSNRGNDFYEWDMSPATRSDLAKLEDKFTALNGLDVLQSVIVIFLLATHPVAQKFYDWLGTLVGR